MLKKLSIALGCGFLLPGIAEAASSGHVEEVRLEAKDGLAIFADLHKSASPNAPTIILFHQAGSNGRGEYAYIVDELRGLGANVMTVDLRSGGDAFDTVNRTTAAAGDAEYGYCDAYHDVEAAVDYVANRELTGPLFLWGSSYSAALVVQYAGLNPERTAGYLAFSPASGAPMEGCEPEQFLASAGPGLIARPESELQYEWIREQYAEFESSGAYGITIKNGVHGSSALNDDRTKHDMSAYREEVYRFIRETAVKDKTSRE